MFLCFIWSKVFKPSSDTVYVIQTKQKDGNNIVSVLCGSCQQTGSCIAGTKRLGLNLESPVPLGIMALSLLKPLSHHLHTAMCHYFLYIKNNSFSSSCRGWWVKANQDCLKEMENNWDWEGRKNTTTKNSRKLIRELDKRDGDLRGWGHFGECPWPPHHILPENTTHKLKDTTVMAISLIATLILPQSNSSPRLWELDSTLSHSLPAQALII